MQSRPRAAGNRAHWMPMLLDRLGLWPARAIWLIAPLTIGSALAQKLESEESTPALIVEISLWLLWFVILVATLTPSPRSLTASRIIGPAAFGAAVLAGLAGFWTGTTLLGLGWAALFTAVMFLPTVGDAMINGSAYGSERRMALRPPALIYLGPAQVAWLLVFGGLVGWPILLLSERYVLAAVALVLGAAAGWAGSRVLHQLARRWVVFVPAGFVIHDPLMLVDSVLFRRNEVTRLGLAIEGTDTSADDYQDISSGAMGLSVEVALREPAPVTVREHGQARNVELSTILFTPTLPGAMLKEARIRGMRIASAPSAP